MSDMTGHDMAWHGMAWHGAVVRERMSGTGLARLVFFFGKRKKEKEREKEQKVATGT